MELDWTGKAVGLKAVGTTQRSRVQTDWLEQSLIIGTELGSSVDLDQELGRGWTGILDDWSINGIQIWRVITNNLGNNGQRRSHGRDGVPR